MPPVSALAGFVRRFAIPLACFALAVGAWPVLAEMDLFERFYAYSRAHEDWDLDELAILVVNLTVALIFSIVFQWLKLKRVMADREFQRRRAERNARHDPLTGLMNRRAFAEALKGAKRGGPAGRGGILAMVDLDRFKPVNDLYGHAAGDATLQAVARRLAEEVGPESRLARLGGDEFAVAFPAPVGVGEVERIMRRVLQAIARPVDYEDSQIFIGCSVGLAQWEATLSSSEAFRRADKALYTAKAGGRGQFAWYDADLDRRSHERAEIEADLREAILKSEITPWFQPIVGIESDRLVGFEVLARWTHRTRGPIAPDTFIAIAEDSGQVGSLGLSILRQACQAARDWNPALTISFNVSPVQFHDPRLVEQIGEILTDCRFDAHRLIIEVTESSVIHDFSVARARLEALKELGVAVALDDFGTGYSSLASIRKLPFDRIKIDRSFVTNITAEPKNQKIVTGIMALAKGLDLDVTAEGIETVEDLDYLRTLDCSMGQGFFFEQAVPAARVAWLLESRWSDHALGHVGEARDPFSGTGRTA